MVEIAQIWFPGLYLPSKHYGGQVELGYQTSNTFGEMHSIILNSHNKGVQFVDMRFICWVNWAACV